MCQPMKTREEPCCYPNNLSAGIHDAQAFWVGLKSTLVHIPYRYPDGNKVVARCGVWGRAGETDSRLAMWSDQDPNCPRCLGN